MVAPPLKPKHTDFMVFFSFLLEEALCNRVVLSKGATAASSAPLWFSLTFFIPLCLTLYFFPTFSLPLKRSFFSFFSSWTYFLERHPNDDSQAPARDDCCQHAIHAHHQGPRRPCCFGVAPANQRLYDEAINLEHLDNVLEFAQDYIEDLKHRGTYNKLTSFLPPPFCVCGGGICCHQRHTPLF